MNNKIIYLLKLIKCLIYPLIFTLITILITYVVGNFGDINSDSLLLVSGLIIFIVCFILLFFYSKKYSLKYSFKDLEKIPLMSISLATSLNMLIIVFNRIFNIENVISSNSIVIMVLLSGILGPIMEEYLFRGIVFHELKKFNSIKASIIITSIMFAIMHNSFTQIIYAFCIGYAVIKLYNKTNNFIVCLLFHICANTFISLVFEYMLLLPNYLLIGLSCFFLLLFYYLYNLVLKK